MENANTWYNVNLKKEVNSMHKFNLVHYQLKKYYRHSVLTLHNALEADRTALSHYTNSLNARSHKIEITKC